MKSYHLYLILILFFFNGCSNDKIIQKKEKWLNEKISQLNCGDSIVVNEMCYFYAVKRLRKGTTNVIFADKNYYVKKLNESAYILYGGDSLSVKIDGVFVGTSHGVIREMLIDIKKICR